MTIDKLTFLQHVLPELEDNQYYCSVFIGKSGIDSPVEKTIQKFHTSLDDLAQATATPPEGIWNTYYLVATSKAQNRRRETIGKHKAFFVDVDLKEYKDKQQAAQGLKQFCDIFELPMPSIVDSGNGIHAYWSLTESISSAEWVKVAEHLKSMCLEHKFHADHNCTADISRILRVPDTRNMKDPSNPKLAVCAYMAPAIDFGFFKELLCYVERDSFEELELAYIKKPTDSLTNAILNANAQHKLFKHGLILSMQGAGCALLGIAYKHQELLSEPQWRSALSIAQFCNDKGEAIHQISKRYSGYDKAETEDKAARIEAPHTCETFRSVFAHLPPAIPVPENGKSYCEVCPHKKDIHSPIRVCMVYPEAQPEDNIINVIDADTGSDTTIVIPAEMYPAPYHRGIDGGVYKRARIDMIDDGEIPSLQEMQGKVVYQYDLWVDSLQVDPVAGEIVVVHMKQPREPLKRFAIPLSNVTALAAFTDALSKQGVAAPSYPELMNYVKAYVTKLQATTDKIKCPASFGWEGNFSSFVLGTRRYLPTGEVEYSLPSAAAQQASDMYGLKNLNDVQGSNEQQKREWMLKTWQEIFKIHERPGQEARLFAVFLSMGSPLFAFFRNNIDGAVLHLVNKESGVGKSTVQHVCTSVWGKPDKDSLMNLSDKQLSVFHHLGVLRHIVLCVDELTTMAPDKACQFVFDVSSGRGRNRMEAQVNKMRANTTSWCTPVITSGNNGMHQLMTQFKIVADGEAMRVMELPIVADLDMQTAENKAVTDKLFGEDIQNCYGIIGDMLLKHYVPNADDCRRELLEIRKTFDIKAGLTSRERYYSALCATALMGATVSKRLGVHDVDLDKFTDWVADFCRGAVGYATGNRLTLIEQMREFLHDMAPFTTITSVIGKKTHIKREPPNGLTHVRHVDSHDIIYVGVGQLRFWCTTKGVPYNALLDALKNEAEGSTSVYRLDNTSCTNVRCIKVTASKLLGEEPYETDAP
jgi:hypothetical protein